MEKRAGPAKARPAVEALAGLRDHFLFAMNALRG